MIIDDNQLVLTLLARMLQNEYNITEFMDARSALAAVKTGIKVITNKNYE